MKNPLEYSLLEIVALMREAGDSAPEKQFNDLLLWVRERQKYLTEYQVMRERELAKVEDRASNVSARAARVLDHDLLDGAEICEVQNEVQL